MSIMRTALPLVLLTGVLTGCAGLQKTDWPTCAAVGGVTGAALGATESSSWAGGGALLVGGLAGAYCWVNGDGDEDGDGGEGGTKGGVGGGGGGGGGEGGSEGGGVHFNGRTRHA